MKFLDPEPEIWDTEKPIPDPGSAVKKSRIPDPQHMNLHMFTIVNPKLKNDKMTWMARTAYNWAWRRVRLGLHRLQHRHPPIPWRGVAAPAKRITRIKISWVVGIPSEKTI